MIGVHAGVGYSRSISPHSLRSSGRGGVAVAQHPWPALGAGTAQGLPPQRVPRGDRASERPRHRPEVLSGQKLPEVLLDVA